MEKLFAVELSVNVSKWDSLLGTINKIFDVLRITQNVNAHSLMGPSVDTVPVLSSKQETQPEAPTMVQPEAPTMLQPEAPTMVQPETPTIAQPETLTMAQPETPKSSELTVPRRRTKTAKKLASAASVPDDGGKSKLLEAISGFMDDDTPPPTATTYEEMFSLYDDTELKRRPDGDQWAMDQINMLSARGGAKFRVLFQAAIGGPELNVTEMNHIFVHNKLACINIVRRYLGMEATNG